MPKDIISEAKLDTPPGYIASAQWYDEYDKLNIDPPKLVIDVKSLLTDPADDLFGAVYAFLTEHGLDEKHAQAMADKLIERRHYLHPSTLGVIVQPVASGHWQIIAERGQ